MNILDVYKEKQLPLVRYLTFDIELPYSYEDIKFQANDTVSSDLLNLKFEHLYDNFLYLYGASLISSNVIPVSSTAVAGVTALSNKFTWYSNLSTSNFVSISSIYDRLDSTNLVQLIKNNDINQYTSLFSTGTAIVAFNFNTEATYLTPVLLLDQVDPGFGVRYKSISAMELVDNFLFVLDSSLNKLVKYDASGFTSNDNITKNKLVYLNSIGNKGPSYSKLEFDSPTGLTSHRNNVYVLDSNNKCVKMYDVNLNWVATYRLNIDLKELLPLDIAADSNGNLFLLTNKNFIKYDSEFQTKQIFDLENTFPGEAFSKIVFSKTFKDVFYLVSDKNVYKKFASTPSDTVGKYLLYLYNYNIPNDKIMSFSCAPCDNNGDRTILFSFYNNVGKLGYFYDNLNLYDILAIRNFDIYTFDEIKFNTEEYLQNWVFNKTVSKMIINLMRFRDQIIGKFIGSQDNKGNIAFEGTRYLMPDEQLSIYFEQDIYFYVGANEIVSNNICNRVMKKLFDVQNSLKNILQAEVTNKPGLTKIVTLN